jgi:hypothetical protein
MDIGSWVTTTTKKSPFARSCGKDPEVAFIAEPNGYAVQADVAVGLVTGLFWGNEPVTGSDAPISMRRLRTQLHSFSAGAFALESIDRALAREEHSFGLRFNSGGSFFSSKI